MVDNKLSSISLRNGTETIVLRRPSENGVAHAPAEAAPQEIAAPLPQPVHAIQQADDAAAIAVDEKLITITSPMVGTFYSSSTPEAPPFMEVGSQVAANSVVCIIEAMKVFNEIRAEITGTIEKILVPNESAVEYGQPLFLVNAG